MTTKLKRHILQEYKDVPYPDNNKTYCGKIIPLQRRVRWVSNWDDATCLICIKLAEEDNKDWKHPSHRS